VKVGARGLDADIERLRAVRRAVGGDVSLRADANGAWDRETAREAVERLAPLDLAYLEQPLPADDLDGAAALRTVGERCRYRHRPRSPVPIALDESLATRGLDAVLDADAADAVVLKPMALGGPDRALAAARRAREAGVEPVVTTDRRGRRARAPPRSTSPPLSQTYPLRARHRLPARHGPRSGSLPDLGRRRVTVPTDPGLAGDAFDDLL